MKALKFVGKFAGDLRSVQILDLPEWAAGEVRTFADDAAELVLDHNRNHDKPLFVEVKPAAEKPTKTPADPAKE